MKGFYSKKDVLEHSNDVLSRRHLHLVSVLYDISPLLSLIFCSVVFVKFNHWLFPWKSALFKWTRTKILLYFRERKGKELQKDAFILNLSS